MEIGNLAQWASAVTSITIAILAIWGEPIRSRLAGPRLSVTLLNPEGEKTTFGGNQPKPTRYYHMRVCNSRRGAPAKNVRVVLTRLAKAAGGNPLVEVSLSGPIQLTWQFPGISPQYPTLGPDHTCDLGYVTSDQGFRPQFYGTPNNFAGSVGSGERMRVEVRALADNAESKPLFAEISWDGKWSDDTAEMRRHLVVRQVESLEGA